MGSSVVVIVVVVVVVAVVVVVSSKSSEFSFNSSVSTAITLNLKPLLWPLNETS